MSRQVNSKIHQIYSIHKSQAKQTMFPIQSRIWGSKRRWTGASVLLILLERVAHSRKVSIVAGHFMFWPKEGEIGEPAYTRNDLDTFTHTLYLNVPTEVVAQRHLDNKDRNHPSLSVTHLHKRQSAEMNQLRVLCRNYGICFRSCRIQRR